GYLLAESDGKIQPPTSDRGTGWYDTGDIARVDNDGYFYILGRAKRFAKLGGEMVSLTAVEELATQTWPGFNHAAVSLPDDKKGEKIILITNNKDALRKHFQEQIKKEKHGELYLPRNVLLAEELPVLGTGKIDYVTLTQMAQNAEDEGSSWIKKLTTFVKNVGKQSKSEQEEEETNAQSENSVDEDTLTETETTHLLPDELEEDDEATIRKEPEREKSTDDQ
ncbi:MAG: hypothetical protein V3W03_05455, partial [Gammaproteobacteria bacterium]